MERTEEGARAAQHARDQFGAVVHNYSVLANSSLDANSTPARRVAQALAARSSSGGQPHSGGKGWTGRRSADGVLADRSTISGSGRRIPEPTPRRPERLPA